MVQSDAVRNVGATADLNRAKIPTLLELPPIPATQLVDRLIRKRI
jgi:hypothetical protein